MFSTAAILLLRQSLPVHTSGSFQKPILRCTIGCNPLRYKFKGRRAARGLEILPHLRCNWQCPDCCLNERRISAAWVLRAASNQRRAIDVRSGERRSARKGWAFRDHASPIQGGIRARLNNALRTLETSRL